MNSTLTLFLMICKVVWDEDSIVFNPLTLCAWALASFFRNCKMVATLLYLNLYFKLFLWTFYLFHIQILIFIP